MAIRSDNPIHRAEEDSIGRNAIARSFARQVLGLDASEGVVVGVLGPWGSGKTSFVNLARPEFEHAGVPILEFNPWMFSGAEQLVESFFAELAAQLRVSPGFATIGKEIGDYGEAFSAVAWIPVVGPWAERLRSAAKLLGRFAERRREGVAARRAKLVRALGKLEEPIIVLVDDIDRLSTQEIRDIFRLVRLTASFPNMVYVLSFDRSRVESALEEQNISGRLYLEKILQVAIDLPAVAGEVLGREVLSEIDAALRGVERPGPFEENLWADVFPEVIRPLIRNMRDVRRYVAAVRGTVESLEGQIALVDVLALEAVRVFLPDVFQRLHEAVEALTSTANSFGTRDDNSHLKDQVVALLKAAQIHEEVVRRLLKRIFPASERHLGGSQYGHDWLASWLKKHRVAHSDFLKLYLERVAGDALIAFNEAEQAWTCLAERARLDSFLRSLKRERLPDVIEALTSYEDSFEPRHVVPTTIVLSNLVPDLPERRGMLEMNSRFSVGRVTYRLLRRLPNPAAVEDALRQILPEVNSLSSRHELIRQVGHKEGQGFKFVSEDATAELEKQWRNEVRSAPVHRLIADWDLLGVLLSTKLEAQEGEAPFVVDGSPEMTLAVLKASRQDVRSQSLQSRSVHHDPQLAWDLLIQLYGGEAILRERIDELRATNPEGAGELFNLVDKYLSGSRPDHFGDWR